MLRRTLLAALPTLAAGAAHAAGAPAEKPAAIGQYVDLSPVAAPIIVNGRLINYVFVTVRLLLTASADAAKWRSREPYFRDALVRAVHRAPVTSDKTYVAVDEAKLKAVMLREAQAIAGRDVTGVAITAQAPKRSTGLPSPPLKP